jgi:3-isopropylmalate/(R)-2-methylmalate dehydratase large subunit
MNMPATLFDKIWDPHVIADLGSGWSLLHCDRVLLHDLSGGRALREVGEAGYAVPHPELAFATPDHAVATSPGRTAESFPKGGELIAGLRKRAA